MKEEKISINDFSFHFMGRGHYTVTFKSKSGKDYTTTTNDMPLIDATRNAEHGEAKIKDLERLRRVCKK